MNRRGNRGSVRKDQVSTNENWVFVRFGGVGLSVNAIGHFLFGSGAYRAHV
jgi:hypothetical protein